MVYVLGHGSGWENNELRYSLRSLETHLLDIGTVYVVGQRPNWLTGVVHLPFPDSHACKERNIMLKLAYACGHPKLSQTFLHVHDDHFALAPTKAVDIPNWAGGQLNVLGKRVKLKKPGNNWADAVLNTHKALAKAGHTTHNFDLHYPMLFDKTRYPETMDLYDWKGEPRGFVVKSLYANTLGLEPTIKRDIKLGRYNTLTEIVGHLKGRQWFSIDNAALTLSFKSLLMALYPTPSRYELK